LCKKKYTLFETTQSQKKFAAVRPKKPRGLKSQIRKKKAKASGSTGLGGLIRGRISANAERGRQQSERGARTMLEKNLRYKPPELGGGGGLGEKKLTGFGCRGQKSVSGEKKDVKQQSRRGGNAGDRWNGYKGPSKLLGRELEVSRSPRR